MSDTEELTSKYTARKMKGDSKRTSENRNAEKKYNSKGSQRDWYSMNQCQIRQKKRI